MTRIERFVITASSDKLKSINEDLNALSVRTDDLQLFNVIRGQIAEIALTLSEVANEAEPA